MTDYSKFKVKLMKKMKCIWLSTSCFYYKEGLSRSASLAYAALLSLVPFCALGFGILASFAASQEYVPQLQEYIFSRIVPDHETSRQVSLFFNQLSQELTRSEGFSVSMIVFFVISSILFISSIESALNLTWQVSEQRPLTRRIGIFCTIVLMAPIITLAAFILLTSRLQFILNYFDIKSMGSPLFGEFLTQFYPLMLVAAAFTVLYWIVPTAYVAFRSAFTGGLIGALLFSVAYIGFGYYISEYASYNKLYGALAAVPIFLIWLYVVSVVILLGSEISFQVQTESCLGHQRGLPMGAGPAGGLLAIEVLIILAKVFEKGIKPLEDHELIKELDCSPVILSPILNVLEKNNYIMRGADSRKSTTLARSLDKIDPEKIRALFSDREAFREAVQATAGNNWPEITGREE